MALAQGPPFQLQSDRAQVEQWVVAAGKGQAAVSPCGGSGLPRMGSATYVLVWTSSQHSTGASVSQAPDVAAQNSRRRAP